MATSAAEPLSLANLVRLRDAALRCAKLSHFRTVGDEPRDTDEKYQRWLCDLYEAVNDGMELLADFDTVIVPDPHFVAKREKTTSAHNAAVAIGQRTWQVVEEALETAYRERHPKGDFDAACRRSFPRAVWVDGSKAAVFVALAQQPSPLPDPLPGGLDNLEAATWREYNAAVRVLRDHRGAVTIMNDTPDTDPTAFRPAKEFLDSERFPTFKVLHKTLDVHPEIRRRTPRGQRLEIHAGDWQKMLNEQPAVDPPDQITEEEVKAAIKEVDQQRAKIRHARK